MKKVVVAVASLAMGMFAVSTAKADTDVFGTQQQLDSSYSLRRTTTEQFDPVRGQSVLDRPRPDYDPTPISVSSFNFFPSLDVGTSYNSNIFAQQSNATSDEIWTVDPAVSLLSNWGRHAVAFTASGDMNWYTQNGQQSFNNAITQLEGRYDLAEQTWLSGAAGYQRVTELRGNPSTPGSQAAPSQYNLYTANAEAYRNAGIVSAKLDYDAAYYEYSAIQLIGGGDASQSVRDRMQNDIEGEVDYNYTENFKPYVKLGYNWRDYTNTGLHSSNGYNADIGARADFGGIVTAQAYIGYLGQNYYNFNNGLVQAVDYGADILWNVTTLDSLEAKANRSIEETTNGSASSYVVSGGSLNWAHELRRDLLLESSIAYNGLDFQKVVEHDDYYYVSGGARYFINRNLHTDFTYDYQMRESSAAGLNFDQHIFLLRVGAQY